MNLTIRIQLKTSLTWSFIQIFANETKTFYPTWIVRVYYYDLINKSRDDIENLEKRYPNLDFCDVENLPVLGNMKYKLPGKMQRFLSASMFLSSLVVFNSINILVDPFVGVAMVRDLDSENLQTGSRCCE